MFAVLHQVALCTHSRVKCDGHGRSSDESAVLNRETVASRGQSWQIVVGRVPSRSERHRPFSNNKKAEPRPRRCTQPLNVALMFRHVTLTSGVARVPCLSL